ncbi:chaperone clpB [Atlantibacter hermannii]|nr:chaperone clpB [Atlantibacter hermannii]
MARGREIDFRNTVILMTSNLGSDHLMQLLEEQPEATDADLHELIRPILRDHFQPALLARFQTVIYRPLAENAMRTIVEMKLAQVSQRLHLHYGLTTSVEENLYDTLTAACLLPDTGARNIDSLPQPANSAGTESAIVKSYGSETKAADPDP